MIKVIHKCIKQNVERNLSIFPKNKATGSAGRDLA